MRIPDSPGLFDVAPQGARLPGGDVVQPTGFESLARAVGEIGQAADKINEAYVKEQHEVRVQQASAALTNYDAFSTNLIHGNPSDVAPGTSPDAAFAGQGTDTGFLGKEGEAAISSSVGTFETLRKKREAIAEGIEDPVAKKIFLQQSAKSLMASQRTIEGHVTQQIEQVKLDTIENAKDEAVRAAALDPTNDTLARQRIGAVVGALSGLGRGPEFEQKHALDVQQQVAATRIDTLLARNDVGAAERVLNEDKYALGTRLDNYTRAVAQARQNMDAATLANGIVDKAAAVTQDRPFAAPDRGEAERLIASLPPEQQQRVAPIVASRIVLLTEAATANKKAFVDRAVGVYNQNPAGFFTSDIGRRLNQVDAEKWRELHHEVVDFGLRAQALTKEEQKARDDLAVDLMGAMDANTAVTTNLDSFTAGRGLSDIGKARVAEVQKKAQQIVQHGLATPQSRFVEDAAADVVGFSKTPSTKGEREKQAQSVNAAKARAASAFSAFITQHKREPTPEEALDLRASLVQGKAPRTDQAAELAGRAVSNAVVGAPQPPRKVEIVDKQGHRALANEDGLDKWLAAHPDWKRR